MSYFTENSGPEFAIEARDIVRTFHVGDRDIEVLKGVSLSVKPGEKTFLCGPSGAGKTSLLYTLAGLERPTSGQVIIEGISVYEERRRVQAKIRNAKLGYVFQNFLLLPELTAVENVALPSLIGGRQAKDKATELLSRVGLDHRLNHLPNELSGGEQQRVAIARSMVNDPRILFADEPTGNLDPKTGAEVMELLYNLIEEDDRTMLVVTHDTKLAQTGDRLVILKDGVVAQ
ncbi:MAG: ABC transporter ATP-binding protein [Verrucomicrobiota bacterium]